MALNLAKFNDKFVFDLAPLIEPKITLNNDFKEVGKNIITKFVPGISLRKISLEYFVRDLARVRDIESFFINSCKGRLESFYMPSFKKDFEILGESANNNNFSAKRQNSNFGVISQILNISIPQSAFMARVIDVRVDTVSDSEIVVLDRNFSFKIDKDTIINELIKVRFDNDSFEVLKEANIGYKIALEFAEVMED
ncbi:hypothetical protein OFO10_05935 [Campylobacter sp. VBCF_06 NA8]|uniref:hypothetical protein n=1 Tax=Campylobacter sp. VBCF_06 NA8 TaxID=2983822 RepID=UPI0022E9B8EA|nr:hypothetical protein [Campylobacter sp. VBCF_06 NA8]MDA3046694.1 hypothetical protein [Campylobacter sp. VBCF_06 NA8]